MERIVGIDYGLKRTGIAVSDPLRIFASPLQTVPTAKIIDYLQKYASEQTITLFVVGYPLNMDGNPSQIAGHVDAFLKLLAKKFPGIPIQKEDERFTSVLAHRAMIEGGMKKKDRMDKGSVDKISAAILLQSFLDREQTK